MAQIQCRWRNVLICLCSPCICIFLLLSYIMIMVCMTMNSTSAPGVIVHGLDKVHFIASGSFRNKSRAPIAKTFWDLEMNNKGFWNHLQHAIDLQFNPILHPNNIKTKTKSGDNESLLMRSFSDVTDSDIGRKKYFAVLSEPIQEFVRHMQRRDYPSILQPDGVCGAGAKDEKKPPLLLLAIKTTELNFQNRQAIRQTWGQVGWQAGHANNTGGYIRRVFLLGKEDPEGLGVDVSQLLRMESQHYGDILQWDFKDTFFNLTLKDVLFWSWFSSHCSQALFVFKGDDDVFVNTPKVITYLLNELKKPRAQKTIKDFMIGDVIGAASPDRVNVSKYFVPDSFYTGLYPSYAGGGGVVYSGLMTKRLHRVSKMVHLYPIDDVYVGMCMQRLNAYPIHHPAFLTFGFPKKEGNDLCSYHTILLIHKRSPKQLVSLWADLKKTQMKCWDVPLRQDNKPKL